MPRPALLENTDSHTRMPEFLYDVSRVRFVPTGALCGIPTHFELGRALRIQERFALPFAAQCLTFGQCDAFPRMSTFVAWVHNGILRCIGNDRHFIKPLDNAP